MQQAFAGGRGKGSSLKYYLNLPLWLLILEDFPSHVQSRLDWGAEELAAEVSAANAHLEESCKHLHGSFTRSDTQACRRAVSQLDCTSTNAARSAAAAQAPPGAIGAEYQAARRQLQLEGERATTKRTLMFLVHNQDKSAAEDLLRAAVAQELLSQDSQRQLTAQIAALAPPSQPLAPRSTNTAPKHVGGAKRRSVAVSVGQRTLSFAKAPRVAGTSTPAVRRHPGSAPTVQPQAPSKYAAGPHTCLCRRCGCICAADSACCPLCGGSSLASGAQASSAVARAFRPRNPWEAAAVANAVRPEQPVADDDDTVTLLDSQ